MLQGKGYHVDRDIRKITRYRQHQRIPEQGLANPVNN